MGNGDLLTNFIPSI